MNEVAFSEKGFFKEQDYFEYERTEKDYSKEEAMHDKIDALLR